MKKLQKNEETKLLAVKLYLSGKDTLESLGKKLKVAQATVSYWVKRYQATKKVKRLVNPLAGRQSKINHSNIQAIFKILKQPASEFGYETDLWTTQRLQQVLKKKLSLDVSRMSIHRTLKNFNYSYHKPESRYYHKNKKKNTKRWVEETVIQIKDCLRKYRGILYFQDEASISLSPVVGKTWGPKGQKIVRIISPNRGSVSAISAVSLRGNLLFNIHDKSKRFNSDDIIKFLKEMLEHHKGRHLVVVMDCAPCHTSKKVSKFIESQKRLHIFFLPPRTPEFNPDEYIWGYLKNHLLKEHKARTTKELKGLTTKKLKKLATNKTLVSRILRGSEGIQFFI